MFCSLLTIISLPYVLLYLRSGSVLIIGFVQFWICFQILKKSNFYLGLKLVFEHSHHFVEDCMLLYI